MQTYADMKDSGVAWLGKIPADWNILPLYGYVKEKKQRNVDNIEKNVLSLSYGKIKKRDLDNGGLLPESFETYQIVQTNDIILRLTDLQNDKRSLRVGRATQKGIITSAYVCITPTKLDSKYLYYLLHGYDLLKVFYNLGGGLRQGMKFGDLKRLPVFDISFETQQKIADFLDTETAQIDNLIAKQERLLELLEEKRRATITHAVTRGLNPNVELKETNIPWLGQIPKHWNVVRLGRLFRENRNTNSDLSSLAPMKFGFGKIVQKPFTPDEQSREELRRYVLIEPKDIMVNGLNLNYDFVTQRIAMVEKGGCMTPAYISLRRRSEDIMPEFYKYTLKSLDSQKVLNGWGTGIRLTLNYSELKKKELPQPSIEEQRAIVEHLGDFIAKSDELKQKIQTQITLLHERRTALISHAVTGKVKV